MKTINAKTGALFGIAALVLIAFLTNWTASLTSLGSRGIDLTEDRVHSISAGTKSILEELDAPVTIRYYATRKSTFLPREVKLYMKKVDDFLKQYEAAAQGKLRTEYLDPQPDTDAEDSANLDGVSGQRINDENIYFGLSVQCLDKKATIPFLSPENETMLEYELSRAIAEVTQVEKPVIGLISALPVAGSGAPSMPGQPAGPPEWVIYEQLSQQFEIRDLSMTPSAEAFDDLSVLLLIHPAGITKETEFQIDQFVLKGGTLIAALDGYSYLASQMTPPRANPMMPPQGGIPTGSTLPTLLSKWGVTFESSQVLADGRYRSKLGGGQVGLALLSMTPEAMPLTDDIVTQGINDLFIPFPGAFTTEAVDGVKTAVMLESSPEAAFVEAARAVRLDPGLLMEMRPEGQNYPLILRLSGSFQTAFPKGDPGALSKEGDPGALADQNGSDEAPADAPPQVEPSSLQKSEESGTVFLIADSDMFYDQFAYRVQNLGGLRLVSPQSGNASLLQNMLDMATGSKHLIGARSRAPSRRPFTVVQEMEADFEQRAGEKLAALEAEQEKVQTRLTELQSQKQSGTEMLLSPEQQQEILALRQEQVDFGRQIRELQKDLKREKDALAARVTLANVAVLPAGVLLAGLVVFFQRRRQTRAK